MGYSPWGCKDSDMTELLNIATMPSDELSFLAQSHNPWSQPVTTCLPPHVLNGLGPLFSSSVRTSLTLTSLPQALCTCQSYHLECFSHPSLLNTFSPFDVNSNISSFRKPSLTNPNGTCHLYDYYNCTFIFDIISFRFFPPTRLSPILLKRSYIFCSLLDPQQHKKGSIHLVE